MLRWDDVSPLTRKCRQTAHRMQVLKVDIYLISCICNFCGSHQELSKVAHKGEVWIPAMANGLTDHLWMIHNRSDTSIRCISASLLTLSVIISSLLYLQRPEKRQLRPIHRRYKHRSIQILVASFAGCLRQK